MIQVYHLPAPEHATVELQCVANRTLLPFDRPRILHCVVDLELRDHVLVKTTGTAGKQARASLEVAVVDSTCPAAVHVRVRLACNWTTKALDRGVCLARLHRRRQLCNIWVDCGLHDCCVWREVLCLSHWWKWLLQGRPCRRFRILCQSMYVYIPFARF